MSVMPLASRAGCLGVALNSERLASRSPAPPSSYPSAPSEGAAHLHAQAPDDVIASLPSFQCSSSPNGTNGLFSFTEIYVPTYKMIKNTVQSLFYWREGEGGGDRERERQKKTSCCLLRACRPFSVRAGTLTMEPGCTGHLTLEIRSLLNAECMGQAGGTSEGCA